ncbi:KAP family P-loop NTPase fold protein [Winogradskyella sediminis]|uniref:KAP family P-loop NTPase fold protein n=1 Tax=Winogradskyella sediminis TaxID=1382466 RepID=UPI003AA8C649
MWKDSETNIDLLDFDYLISMTKDIIENDELSPSSIGVYGDWGSGKSSLAEMALKELSKNEDYVCLKFNGWLFEGYEDAKTALIGSILDKIAEKKKPQDKALDTLNRLYKSIDFFKLASKGVKYGADFLITGGIGTIADLTLKSVLSSVKETNISEDQVKKSMEAVFKNSEIRDNLKSFQDDFKDLLDKTNIKKLVVFIDELDRCNHDTILETLEAIRLFLFAPGTSFILGADERQVMYAVRKKFPEVEGNHIDIGKEYLEKMIQYPVKIPQLGVKEVEYYITCLLFKDAFKNDFGPFIDYVRSEKKKDFINFEIKYEIIAPKFKKLDEKKLRETISLSKQLSSVLSSSLKGNPRHCKRFLNALSMRIKMASFKGLDLDKKVLAKIMLIEYFKDSLYKQLSDLQSNEKGKPKELEFIENGEWENVVKLKIWKDDSWVLNWVKLEPALFDTDLQPYFYFTRESLQQAHIISSSSLSTEANLILKNLQTKSDVKIRESIKKAPNLSPFEAQEVLKELINQIQISSDIDSQLFKAFISFGETKESLYSDVIMALNSLPADKIKPAFIIRTIEFFKVCKKTTELKELTDRWIKEGPEKLKKIIEQELK